MWNLTSFLVDLFITDCLYVMGLFSGSFSLFIIFLFFLNGVSLSLFGCYLGRRYAVTQTFILSFLATSFCFIRWFWSSFLVKEVALSINIDFWFNAGLTPIGFGFIFTNFTFLMLTVVTLVATLVHCYAINYMITDPHLIRFLSYLSLFTFCMLLLICSDNLVQFFLSWEGVGVCSYLLINFWFTRVEANKSALKALILNRIGDFFLLAGIGIIFFLVRTSDFAILQNHNLIRFVWEQEQLFALEQYFKLNRLELAALFFFFGAVGKSAQIGLHTWLPDAMEGPTPVSALIHAATMVTAGVFLLIKCSFLFQFNENLSCLIALIGLTTAIFAGTVACFQYDIKKVIAYSTCSQLGFMVFSCGLHQYIIAFFHLLTHAFFKALLFLTAGAIIHFLGGEQDIRRMGGIHKLAPLMSTNMLIGSLALTGFPFLAGYYSKDAILETAYSSFNSLGVTVYFFAIFGAFITAYYSLRLYFLIFFGKNKVQLSRFNFLHGMGLFMRDSLYVLSIFSIFSGYLLSDIFLGFGSLFFIDDAVVLKPFLSLTDIHFVIPRVIKFLPLIVLTAAVININWLHKNALYVRHLSANVKINYLTVYGFFDQFVYFFIQTTKTFLNKRWFFDSVYNIYVTKPLLNFGYAVTYVLIDKGFIEFFGPQLFVNFLFQSQQVIRKLHDGQIRVGFRVLTLGVFTLILLILNNLL